MAEDLKAQEIRGMAKYATDEPASEWGAEFWKKFDRWAYELFVYERLELAEFSSPAPRQQVVGNG